MRSRPDENTQDPQPDRKGRHPETGGGHSEPEERGLQAQVQEALMTPETLKETMARLELSDADLAVLLGVDRSAVEKGVVTKHRLKVLATGG
jgi:hypothetical protein